MTDYDRHLATRLTKLATGLSTGMAPVTSPAAGAFYFQDGQVALAECSRTPGPGTAMAGGEATIDAALELLSNRSASGRFRPSVRSPAVPFASAIGFAVDDLLAEVARRRRVLRQMAGFTADTTVTRAGRLDDERVQVSAAQWALIIRVYPGSTPRGLAWTLGRSVFCTTADLYQLICLGLLSAAAMPDPTLAVSFTEALISEKGT